MKVHIGKEIRRKIESIGMTKAEFARRMNRSPQAVQWWFQKESIDTGTLVQVSEILNFNFFTCYIDKDELQYLNEEGSVYNPKSASTETILRLKKDLADCKKENSYLSEINELLKQNRK